VEAEPKEPNSVPKRFRSLTRKEKQSGETALMARVVPRGAIIFNSSEKGETTAFLFRDHVSLRIITLLQALRSSA